MSRSAILLTLTLLSGASILACEAGGDVDKGDGGGATTGGTGGGGEGGANFGGEGPCDTGCSIDSHAVIDCTGTVIEQCSGSEGCSFETKTCMNACEAAVANGSSVGCEYYATFMTQYDGETVCFAAFIANTWDTPVHVTVEYQGASLPVGDFLFTTVGTPPNQVYIPVDASDGIPPGEIGVMFLSGATFGTPVNCPAPGAVQTGAQVAGTGVGHSFRIETDVPIVAYQINPYGGGSAATTGASLLLPTSVWGTNYVAANAGYSIGISDYYASMNIIAKEDATTVTMVPVAAVVGGGTLPAGAFNTPYTFMLNQGEQAQFSQFDGLMGSIISSDKPVGFMAGHKCQQLPVGTAACDHGEQMVPPINALGSEYVGVMHRPRRGEPETWTLVGAVDDTQLTWTPNVDGPSTIDRGEILEFVTGTPFVVKSQGDDYPFLFFHQMSGCQWTEIPTAGAGCYGDPDWVIGIPPKQYDYRYIFYADQSYPETSLVLVRSAVGGEFLDVHLDCLGVVPEWTAISNDYQFARVDLSTGDFEPVGDCEAGGHEIHSDGPFGLWVWGWGTPETTVFTEAVSYGFPGGMKVRPINQVEIPPVPDVR